MKMKRFLLACLGMVLLGTAGLLILHQTVDAPSRIQAQPPGGGLPVIPGEPRQPRQPGQYQGIVPALLEALTDADGGVRQLAAATLVKTGPDAVPVLTEALKAKDRETRANAAYVLGQLGELAQESLPALAKALKDEDKDVRRRAAFAMHNIVTRTEASAVFATSEDAPPGAAGGLVGPPPGVARMPMPGAGPPMPGMHGPWDPGLLLPPETPAPKPEKGQK